jgi:hypothetical protein
VGRGPDVAHDAFSAICQQTGDGIRSREASRERVTRAIILVAIVRARLDFGTDVASQGKSWAKVSPADHDQENRKAPFPGLFQ